jgi:hypothetical protein
MCKAARASCTSECADAVCAPHDDGSSGLADDACSGGCVDVATAKPVDEKCADDKMSACEADPKCAAAAKCFDDAKCGSKN